MLNVVDDVYTYVMSGMWMCGILGRLSGTRITMGKSLGQRLATSLRSCSAGTSILTWTIGCVNTNVYAVYW
jgi:hypothetical protein